MLKMLKQYHDITKKQYFEGVCTREDFAREAKLRAVEITLR